MTSSTWKYTEYPYWTATTIPLPSMTYAPASLPQMLKETYQHGKRWYTDGTDIYPSITTVLSETDEEGRASLTRWRKRIGHTEAEAVTKAAAAHGTKWHDFCEAYLTGKPIWSHIAQPQDRHMAAAIASMLNTHIKTVLLAETRVASREFKVAGRMDICAELTDGRIAVLDFKTGKKPKTGNRLENYGMQATFYASALTESLGCGEIDTIVIAQLCPLTLIWQESSAALFKSMLHARVTKFASQRTVQDS